MKALFISTQDLKRHSVMNGNVDATKFTPYIEQAQDIHVQSYLGTDLYEKLQALIIAGTIGDIANASYKTLLEDFVKPMLVQWSLVMYIPFGGITLANGGLFKHSSENSETLSKEETDYLQEQVRITANSYTDRLVKHLCNNSSLYPEFSTNTGSDINPSHTTDFLNWVI